MCFFSLFFLVLGLKCCVSSRFFLSFYVFVRFLDPPGFRFTNRVSIPTRPVVPCSSDL